MKRFPTLVLVLLVLISSVRSQVITITFEGMLNGAPVPLDSILVMNLTSGGDTTIYFPNNVLVLDGTTGIAPGNPSVMAMQSWPNPFAGSTEVALRATSGELLLTLQDATGRLLKSHTLEVAEGVHRFRIGCGQPGVHLLTARQGAESRTVRLMAIEGQGDPDLRHNGLWASGSAKDNRSLFTWTPGDELRYIGHATDVGIVHSAAMDEVPVATATRTFELFAGLVCPGTPTVTDIDGNIYPVVQIGNQCWMAANLKTTRYRDGIIIPNVTDNTDWTQLTSGAWGNYNNSPGNDTTFGKLYNWYAAANPLICPQGWHVPTDAEWQQLESALGMPGSELGQTSFRGIAQNVGGNMKTTTSWNAPNHGATNESGFSGLPGGHRDSGTGAFTTIGSYGNWWSASESGVESAWRRVLYGIMVGIYRDAYYKRNGFCLRCLRD